MGALAVELSIPSCCASEKDDKKARVSKVESIVRCGVCVSLRTFYVSTTPEQESSQGSNLRFGYLIRSSEGYSIIGCCWRMVPCANFYQLR